MLVYPYKPGSKSARDLSQAIGAKRIRHKGSKLRGDPSKTVINWGSGNLPFEVRQCTVLNDPDRVGIAGNKLLTFKALARAKVRLPNWTEDKSVAEEWLEDGHTVFARTLLRASSGKGIVICEPGGETVQAPLYVKYTKSKSEWRVHVLGGEAKATHRKIRDPKVNPEDVDFRVRNHAAGFIFQRNNDAVPGDVEAQAVTAVSALGLDFGAVDVIYNQHKSEAYVLEVNTAPGLTGETLDVYSNFFTQNSEI